MRIIATVAATLMTGCFYPAPTRCPHAELRRALSSGTFRWTLRGTSGSQSATVSTSSRATPCATAFGAYARWSPGESSTDLDGALSVECFFAPERMRIRISVYVGDVATIAEGRHDVRVLYAYEVPGESERRACEARGTATLLVSNARGGAVPLPALLSGNFERTLNVEIDGASPITGASNGTPCSPLTFTSSMTVTIFARDLSSSPNAFCPTMG